MSERLMRGPLLHCLGEPDKDDAAIDYRQDALLWLKHGLVHKMGHYESMVSELTPAQVASRRLSSIFDGARVCGLPYSLSANRNDWRLWNAIVGFVKHLHLPC